METTDQLKQCSICKVKKCLHEYYNYFDNRYNKQRYASACKGCTKDLRSRPEARKRIEEFNQSDNKKVYMREYRKRNYVIDSHCKKNRIFMKKYRQRDYVKERYKEYMKQPENKLRNRIWNRSYNKMKSLTDEEFMFKRKLRRLISRAIIYKKSSNLKPFEILGCDYRDFRSYIESKFQGGMNWYNHGRYGWHIDHIKPLSWFNLRNQDEIKLSCHYTNLQPLWAKDNLKKHNCYIG
jgi:hypothetical protein